MNSNLSDAERMREAVDRAFTPDLSLTWTPTLRGWTPTTWADRTLLRQLNGGDTLVRNIDQFCADHPGLTIETISP